MSGRDLFDEACRSLVAHRLRAALSALGIICGVATVVAALAVAEGARRQAVADVGALGIDNVYVRAAETGDRTGADAAAAPELTLADFEAVAHERRAKGAAAAVRYARLEVSAGPRQARATMAGVTPAWLAVTGVAVSEGRELTVRDGERRGRVALIGARLRRRLFPAGGAIGADLRASGEWYRVVGVVAVGGDTDTGQRPAGTPQRIDLADALIVPRAAMPAAGAPGEPADRLDEIVVRTGGPDELGPASAALARTLVSRGLDAGAFEVVVPRELLRARLRALRTSTVLLFAVGLLALVISGVGIMNIMLASVAERTHEIGVRRAYGARRRDVLVQFTLEAMLLCLVGGAVGVPLGASAAGVVALAAGWPVAISATSVVVAVVLAGSVGLVCGMYPARLAASLHPAVALRAE